MAWDVTILQEELDVLTICKPASVPVSQQLLAMSLVYHAGGRNHMPPFTCLVLFLYLFLCVIFFVFWLVMLLGVNIVFDRKVLNFLFLPYLPWYFTYVSLYCYVGSSMWSVS